VIAVIPAAGLGTRMASITGGSPKELLTVGGKPVLQWTIEEALLAGALRVRVVGSPVKPLIQQFVSEFDNPKIEYAAQERPEGVLDAAKQGLEPGQPGLVSMGDTIFTQGSPLPDLVNKIHDGAWAAVAVEEVLLSETPLYGVVGFSEDGRVNAVVEKPEPLEAPSRWAIASRFCLSAEATDAVFAMASSHPIIGLTLSDLLDQGIKAGKRVEAVTLGISAKRFDCGTLESYLAATAELGR
jgi:dTDP-glucose pyrophosphorylase